MESSPSMIARQRHESPLYPISPERINQQRNSPSPSKSADLSHHQRDYAKGSSAVQSKVAFLNGLARNNSPSPAPVHQHSSTTSAALQRAILGREEAESALEGAVSQLSEARARERKISERVESLLEELQSAKKHQSQERGVYEKEVRKAKKEAFRAGSFVVKAQEELKSAKSEVKGLKEELKGEKEAKDQAKQEAFEYAYKLAGVTEELTALKEKLRSLEANNHSNELDARANEMRESTPRARPVLAEKDPGDITPTQPKPKPNNKSPSVRAKLRWRGKRRSFRARLLHKASPDHRRDSLKENMDPEDIDQDYIEDLIEDYQLQRRLRLEAEDTIKMMHMDCQFLTCPCRRAEMRGERFVYDFEYDKMLQEMEQQKKSKEEERNDEHAPDASGPEETMDTPQQPTEQEDVTMKGTEPHGPQEEEPLIAFSPTTGTFRPVPSPTKDNPKRPTSREAGKEELDLNEGSFYQQNPVSQSALPQQQSYQQQPASNLNSSWQVNSTARDGRSSQFAINRMKQSTSNTPHTPSEPVPQKQAVSEDTNAHNHNHSHHNHGNSHSHSSSHKYNSSITSTTTTTKTVPLKSENRSKTPNPHATIPGTPVTRQEALAQIQARRGRARSNANRSISASEINSRPPSKARAVTPVRRGRRTPATDQRERKATHSTHSKDRRHISAPGRC